MLASIKLVGTRLPLPVSEIMWLKGEGNYTWIHLQDGKKHLLPTTLLWFEERLPAFIRIHRSLIVNPDYIKEYVYPSRLELHIILENGLKLEASRRRVSNTARRLARHL